ncbi:transposase [Oceanobacter antarcticus]|uniref:Transposase n=1 Tax=Oceanobacter antarcticus TaxID=3133425 RepID=A0ABW8ND02_9GAMM
MRGADITQEPLFTTIKQDERVPHDHPLRSIKTLFDQALTHIDWKLSLIYSECGRESIPPERLLRALLLQILFSIRSERQLVEQIQYNMLYRWFVGLSIDEPVWDHSTFSVNRDRLIHHDVSAELFAEVVASAQKQQLLSNDHFSVDGTLMQAWASQKSFRLNHRITPHVARNDKRPGGSAIDGRTSHKTGYAASQIVRKRVEEPFGWGKTVGHLRQLKVKGLAKVNSALEMTMMAYNLVRMAKLQGQSV